MTPQQINQLSELLCDNARHGRLYSIKHCYNMLSIAAMHSIQKSLSEKEVMSAEEIEKWLRLCAKIKRAYTKG